MLSRQQQPFRTSETFDYSSERQPVSSAGSSALVRQIKKSDQNLSFDPSPAVLHADLQSLWKQCASLTVLPEYGEKQRGEEEEKEDEVKVESEQDREILRTERRRRRHSSMKEVGLCEGTLRGAE